jgi:hypothetical protein
MSIPRFIPSEPSQRRVERISQAVVHVDLRGKTDGFAGVRNLLLDWLREKAGSRLTETMLRGETDSLDPLGVQRVETVALADPLVWAARQDFQDERVARRTWVTEAMLASSGPHMAQLGFRLHCVTLGDAAPFSRTVPKFMRAVARSHTVWLDRVEVDLHANAVETEDDTDALVRLLVDKKRRAPVVGISMEENSEGVRALIDADRLASAVFGAGHVRLLTRRASFALTDRVGKRFSVFNGAIRIWWPDFSPDESDPYDEPLWLDEVVREAGETRTLSVIAERVLRASAGRRDADDAIPSFAEARRVAATISREAAANSGRSAGELIQLYEAELDRLDEELKDAKAVSAELIALADEERKAAIAERDQARSELYTLRARLEEMEKSRRRREQEPDIEIPETFDGLAGWSELYIADTIDVLPRAVNAAKKSLFDDPPLAYRALLLMHETYVPMRRSGSQTLKERWESGLQRLGLDCSPAHSSGRAGENPDDYFVKYGGRRREIDMHLKGGNSRDPRYCFRLYFFWDDESKRAVVASLPSHLDNRLT